MKSLTLDIEGAGPIELRVGDTGVILEIPSSTEHIFYRERALKYPRFWNNLLGLYQFVDMTGKSKMNISDFDAAQYNLREVKAGCIYEPTQGVRSNKTTVEAHDVQFQNEQCADAIWSAGWEGLLGKGLGRYDLQDNEMSRALISVAIDKQHGAIGNDYWKQIEFGGHPQIDLADTSGAWADASEGLDYDEWQRLKRQQKVFGGHVTIMDALQTEGKLDNMTIPIHEKDTDGAKYTGDMFRTMDEARERLPQKLVLGDSRIWKLTSSMFYRLRTQIKERHVGTVQAYHIETKGFDGEPRNIALDSRYVIEFDGDYVINCPEWGWLDGVCNTYSHRIGCFAPGTLIVPHDVSPNDQFTGMGMRVHYSYLPESFGKTFMWGAFKTGAALLGQKDYMAYGSLILTK
jgi:hypothetical protein